MRSSLGGGYIRPPVYQADLPAGFANRVSDTHILPRDQVSLEYGARLVDYITVFAWMEEDLADRVLRAMSPEGIGQMTLMTETQILITTRVKRSLAFRLSRAQLSVRGLPLRRARRRSG